MQNITLPIDFFDQDRIKALRCQQDGNTTLLLYIMLACTSEKSDSNGALMIYDGIPFDPTIIANLYGIPIKQTKDILELLIKFGLFTLQNGVYYIIKPAVLCGKKKEISGKSTRK